MQSSLGNPNYSVSFQPGTLTVNPRPLSLSLDSFVRSFGDANPTLTYSLGGVGFASFHQVGDVFDFSTTLPATTANVGHHPLLPRILDARNYAVTLTPGYLTILPRPIQIAVDSITALDGATVPPFSAQIAGLPDGVRALDAFPNFSLTTAYLDNPVDQPVPTAAAYYPPPAATPLAVTTAQLDAQGHLLNPPAVVALHKPPQPPPTSFTINIQLPKTETVGNRTTTTLTIHATGLNNPNYVVTHVTQGKLVTDSANVDTEQKLKDLVDKRHEPLVIRGLGDTGKPLSSPDYGQVLKDAAKLLADKLVKGDDSSS